MSATASPSSLERNPPAPGSRVRARGEEWAVQKCLPLPMGGHAVHVQGVREPVRHHQAIFLTTRVDHQPCLQRRRRHGRRVDRAEGADSVIPTIPRLSRRAELAKSASPRRSRRFSDSYVPTGRNRHG